MLAAVALHPFVAQIKVDLARQHFTHRQHCVCKMQDLAAALHRVDDFDIADATAVAALTAALGKKRRAVEHDGKAVPVGGAGKHARIKGGSIGVCIVKSLGHGGGPFAFLEICPYRTIFAARFQPTFPARMYKILLSNRQISKL